MSLCSRACSIRRWYQGMLNKEVCKRCYRTFRKVWTSFEEMKWESLNQVWCPTSVIASMKSQCVVEVPVNEFTDVNGLVPRNCSYGLEHIVSCSDISKKSQ